MDYRVLKAAGVQEEKGDHFRFELKGIQVVTAVASDAQMVTGDAHRDLLRILWFPRQKGFVWTDSAA